MNRRARLIVLGLLLLLTLGSAWFFHTFEWVPHEIDLPPRGEARYNPLYALGKTLAASGHDVSSRATLDLDAMQAAPGEVLVLATDVRALGAAESAELIDWVAAGGHLVFALPPNVGSREVALLEDLDLPLHEHWGCVRWQSRANRTPGRMCHRTRIDLEPEGFDWAWPIEDSQGGLIAASDSLMQGSWTALPHYRFVSGTQLQDPQHAALAWAVLAPHLGTGRVHLVYATDLPPAYVLLFNYGWPVWVPLLLALLAWLWRRSQRLGPMLPVPVPDRRALLEHLHAAGEFALRRRRGAHLHAALQRRFEARLAREHPQLAALEGEARVEGVADAWQLDPALVRRALLPQDLHAPDAYAEAIRSLSRLQAHA